MNNLKFSTENNYLIREKNISELPKKGHVSLRQIAKLISMKNLNSFSNKGANKI